MDVRQMTRILRLAANGSLVFLGATLVLAGDRQHEQPTRPHMSAACSPNWGFNQTCWSRFPEVPPCQNAVRSDGAQGDENYPSQPMLYTPQNPMTYQGSQSISPADGTPQRPISVFPDATQGNAGATSGGMSPMPVVPTPHMTAPQYFGPSLPSAVPVTPGEALQPASPVPAAPMGLPPLPAPPISAPGHASWQPEMNFNPHQQQFARRAAVSNQALQSGARYGIASRSLLSSQIERSASTPVASGSHTSASVNNKSQKQSGASNPARSSGRYDSTHHASTSGSFATASVTNNDPLPNAAISRVSGGGYSATAGAPVAQTSRIPVSFASQNRVLPKSAGSSTSYRSGRSMPPVVNSPPAGFLPTQLPAMPDYSTIPAEPLRSTP